VEHGIITLLYHIFILLFNIIVLYRESDRGDISEGDYIDVRISGVQYIAGVVNIIGVLPAADV
jgi:hypothetical protein